jgi:hypothetical protein
MAQHPSRVVVLCAAVWLFLRPLASAQILPSDPIQLAEGRIVLGGQLAAAASSARDLGYFNYTDYEHNALRLVRLALSGSFEVTERVSVLGEIQTENWDSVRPYALYVRLRPWRDRAVDIQAGRIPPTFGAYARRAYAVSDPLIGYPLAYQYLTSLRTDALPASADDLLNVRSGGWRVRYPNFVGASTPGAGLPLVTAFRWDTGVQVRVGVRPIEISMAVTTGTLSRPRVEDDNHGKQVAGRLRWQPSAALVVGLSGARGAYVSDDTRDLLPHGASHRPLTQRAVGLDMELSQGYWLVRAESIWSAWSMPSVRAPFIDDPLRAIALSLEGRYKIRPGLYAAARIDHLTFSRVTGTVFDGKPTRWDAPVSRWEAGGGYYIRRNVIGKLTYQHNWRDGGRVSSKGFLAGQILYWF